MNTHTDDSGFSTEQKEYLQGFMAGITASGPLPFVGLNAAGLLTATPAGSATPNLGAEAPEPSVHGTPLSELCREEKWKYDEDPLDAWERILAHAGENRSPDPENNYRFKTHGLFHVAPAQDSFMIRLRIPAGELSSHQLRGLAEVAGELGGGYSHITTRANLQIREFKPSSIVELLTRVQELGLTSKGAGADNIRNITASPDSGFGRDELLDVRPQARALHHYILNHRDLYGLPRKFNVAFDNGSLLSAAADTNDIGFFAVRVSAGSLARAGIPLSSAPAPGIYFRVQLGGITGHRDFAKDTGVLVPPSEAVAVAVAMIRCFRDNGDRTDRKKARLKYLLEKWGVDKFMEESAKRLAFPLRRVPLEACEPRRPVDKQGWLGVRRQSQAGLCSVGIGVPVGRLSVAQMKALAELSDRYGKGELRLTVWQSVLIPHVSEKATEAVCRAARRMGFYTETSLAAGGVIACTGSRGCKYAAADTKGHATELIKYLSTRFEQLGSPVNIHFTGCPNSCAQHYCGDIGLVGNRLPDGAEGYNVVIGGGMDQEQGIARELFKGIRVSELIPLVDRILNTYLAHRQGGESFAQWARRHPIGELQVLLSQ
jgi:ferredoxin-nitrite reductase